MRKYHEHFSSVFYFFGFSHPWPAKKNICLVLSGWLQLWLAVWQTDWLAGWLNAWLAKCLTGCGWLIACLALLCSAWLAFALNENERNSSMFVWKIIEKWKSLYLCVSQFFFNCFYSKKTLTKLRNAKVSCTFFFNFFKT